jgi:hypothetical protein
MSFAKPKRVIVPLPGEDNKYKIVTTAVTQGCIRTVRICLRRKRQLIELQKLQRILYFAR